MYGFSLLPLNQCFVRVCVSSLLFEGIVSTMVFVDHKNRIFLCVIMVIFVYVQV